MEMNALPQCIKSAQELYDLRTKYKEASVLISAIYSESMVIAASLSQVQNLLQHDALQNKPQLLETFDRALTGCRVVYGCLEEEVRELAIKADHDHLKFKDRAKFLWKEETFKELLTQIRGQQSALSLLIQGLQMESLGDIKKLVEENSVTLDQVVKQSKTLQQSHPKVKVPESVFGQSTLVGEEVDTESIMKATEFTFDDEVVNSKAYRRAMAMALSTSRSDLKVPNASESQLSNEDTIVPEPSRQPKYQSRIIVRKGVPPPQPKKDVGISIQESETKPDHICQPATPKEHAELFDTLERDVLSFMPQMMPTTPYRNPNSVRNNLTTLPSQGISQASPAPPRRSSEGNEVMGCEAPPPLPLRRPSEPPMRSVASSDSMYTLGAQSILSRVSSASSHTAYSASQSSLNLSIRPIRKPLPISSRLSYHASEMAGGLSPDFTATKGLPQLYNNEMRNVWLSLVEAERKFVDRMVKLKRMFYDNVIRQWPIIQKHLDAVLIGEQIATLHQQYLLQTMDGELAGNTSTLCNPYVFETWISKTQQLYREYFRMMPHAASSLRTTQITDQKFTPFVNTLGLSIAYFGKSWEDYLKLPSVQLQSYVDALQKLVNIAQKLNEQAAALEASRLNRALQLVTSLERSASALLEEAQSREDVQDIEKRIRTDVNTLYQLRLGDPMRRVRHQGSIAMKLKSQGPWFPIHAVLFDHYFVWGNVKKSKGDELLVLNAPTAVENLGVTLPADLHQVQKTTMLDHIPRGSKLYVISIKDTTQGGKPSLLGFNIFQERRVWFDRLSLSRNLSQKFVLGTEQHASQLEHLTTAAGVDPNDVVAIVTIHHSQALDVNQRTPFPKHTLLRTEAGREPSLDGCHIFLQSLGEDPAYSMGRHNSTVDRDVYFPGSEAGPYQYYLLPLWDSDCWRLQSFSESLATVNGVPIMNSTPRTKKLSTQYPHAVHLEQHRVNHTFIKTLQVDIWLLKTAREALSQTHFSPILPELQSQLQDVDEHDEPWSRQRYIIRRGQVSTSSCRVTQRFTGELETAKLFRDDEWGREKRTEEFRMFAKEKVDASIVRYHRMTEIGQVPAIITDTHEGFQSYAELEAEIKTFHPGIRFSIAAKLLRRLFSALAFLHFKGIIHGSVSKESVLLNLVNSRPGFVLLVDYSAASSFSESTVPPLKEMVEEGKIAMGIVVDCCDIWHLREAAAKDAMSQAFCARKTVQAQKDFHMVERIAAVYFDEPGNSRKSTEGKKLLRLLDLQQNSWHSARNHQLHNSTRREVGMCRTSVIKEMEDEWNQGHPAPKIGQESEMILTLGHAWLDGLATRMYHGRWDATPMDVCAKIKELAGPVEEPWQTISVTRTFTFFRGRDDLSFKRSCIMEWLASHCEAYPEWRAAMMKESDRQFRDPRAPITQEQIIRVRDALSSQGTLPMPMIETFKRLTSEEIMDTMNVRETHLVWYHIPSRMFNATQLHRLANPKQPLTCVSGGHVPCDNFIEVRGEPKIEGHYVPLSMLIRLTSSLGLSLRVPDHIQEFPKHDPADFSHAIHFVVLAHTGLVPWATVTREGAQFNFHAPLMPLTFETHDTFLSTYFGGMKVLPSIVPGKQGVYERLDHWTKFKTASEIDNAAKASTRKVLPANRPSRRAGSRVSDMSGPIVVQASLRTVLKLRGIDRANVSLPKKRGNQVSISETPDPKRTKNTAPAEDKAVDNAPPAKPAVFTDAHMDNMIRNLERLAQGELPSMNQGPPSLNDSLYKNGENSNLNVPPPKDAAALKEDLTIASQGSFDFEHDAEQVGKWMTLVNADDDDQPLLLGIFGWNFHHGLRGDRDVQDTEKNKPTYEEVLLAKARKGKAPVGKETPIQEDVQDATSHYAQAVAEVKVFTEGLMKARNAQLSSIAAKASTTKGNPVGEETPVQEEYWNDGSTVAASTVADEMVNAGNANILPDEVKALVDKVLVAATPEERVQYVPRNDTLVTNWIEETCKEALAGPSRDRFKSTASLPSTHGSGLDTVVPETDYLQAGSEASGTSTVVQSPLLPALEEPSSVLAGQPSASVYRHSAPAANQDMPDTDNEVYDGPASPTRTRYVSQEAPETDYGSDLSGLETLSISGQSPRPREYVPVNIPATIHEDDEMSDREGEPSHPPTSGQSTPDDSSSEAEDRLPRSTLDSYL
ncbi:ankyrin repeat [Pyrenophora seminiperda CCB06]|uniref:Ankyrin repeat n=1 Tax=Pyrenophora seminiperda CCB06 TaxID=1302712 RepID=A0A3M7MFH2_9PLEO|nr:ankyrin repeat [Pyrenophora seminiperda CCB06]